MGAEDLRRLADRAAVPAEEMLWTLGLLAGRDPEAGARFLDRLSLEHKPFLKLLEELGRFSKVPAVRSGEKYFLGLLSSSRHYREAVQALKVIKTLSGLEGDAWSSHLRSLLDGHRGRKRLWEMIGEEGW